MEPSGDDVNGDSLRCDTARCIFVMAKVQRNV
jgi:hypothetical protein